MNEKFDFDLFEFVICQKSIVDTQYLASILDYYDPSYFNNTDIRFIMDVVVSFFQKKNTLPTWTEIRLAATTEEQKQSLLAIYPVIKTLDKDYNIDELYLKTEQFLREKAVYNALLNTTENMSNNNIDTNVILDTFTNACTISLVDNLGLDFFEKINEISDEIIKPDSVISTGWKWLDERIGGGWQTEGKALYMFTGFTNVGKSIFLGNAAVNMLKQNKTVVLITLEMSETMYAKRICSNLSEVPMDTMIEQIEDMKASLYSFKNKYNSKLIIKEFPTKSMTVHTMNSFLQKLIKKGIKPDVFIVDYLNLMKGKKQSNGGLYEEVKDISEQLRASTYMFKIPCISATQLNRKGAGKEEPGMDTISESIGTSFTSDVQMSIWSDESDKKLGVTHLGLQKNRFGPNYGILTLNIDYKTLSISETPSEISSISNQQIQKGGLDSTLDVLNKSME